MNSCTYKPSKKVTIAGYTWHPAEIPHRVRQLHPGAGKAGQEGRQLLLEQPGLTQCLIRNVGYVTRE